MQIEPPSKEDDAAEAAEMEATLRSLDTNQREELEALRAQVKTREERDGFAGSHRNLWQVQKQSGEAARERDELKEKLKQQVRVFRSAFSSADFGDSCERSLLQALPASHDLCDLPLEGLT